MSRTGNHDRRGFEMGLKVCLVMIGIGFLTMLLYNWKIGLGMIMVFSITFITLEGTSHPPENNPIRFNEWVSRQPKRNAPTLLCIGDSLTHGHGSANYTSEIPMQLSSTLGLPLPPYGRIFNEPIWVVNAGQNYLTSTNILHERLSKAMNVFPDYIVLMIGTNDIVSLYMPNYGKFIRYINELPADQPNMKSFEHNIKSIINFILESSSKVQLGVCTIPPMGENLRSNANRLVQHANDIIIRAVADCIDTDRTTLIPIYAELETVLEKRRNRGGVSVDYFILLTAIVQPLYQMLGVFNITYNFISKLWGNVVLVDGIHLNETGRDIVVQCIVDWLKVKSITKAIAVKKL